MNDLAHFFSLEHRIRELETKLRTATQRASKYKKLYQDLGGKVKQPTRGEKALVLIVQIKAGDLDMTLREVAEKCHLSIHYVLNLSSQYNKRSK